MGSGREEARGGGSKQAGAVAGEERQERKEKGKKIAV